jgi:endoglucanase
MDEVGFMLVEKESDGIFRFKVIGGIDERALAGKPVQVGKKQKPGVIGACPVHLSTREERERILSVDTLRIDTGPGTSEIHAERICYFCDEIHPHGAKRLR